MKTLALIVAIVASPAWAQAWMGVGFRGAGNQGAWTGYVGGYKAVGQPSGGTWTGYVGGFQSSPGVPMVAPPPMGYRPPMGVPYVVGPTWVGSGFTTSNDEQVRAEKAAAAQREWAIAESARAEREENERRLAEERQRAAEERQRTAEERQRVAEERERAAQERLLNEQALATQRALIDLQKAELERQAAQKPAGPPAEAKPQTPGNEVYKWTDDEGVVHYSTKVPPEAASRATVVGGKSKR